VNVAEIMLRELRRIWNKIWNRYVQPTGFFWWWARVNYTETCFVYTYDNKGICTLDRKMTSFRQSKNIIAL